jgi:DNA-binding transcriptional LysR family regulator
MDPALLPSLAWFIHIARHKSFTKAAAEMGVSRPVLSQHLKVLEAELGVRLIHRTTRDMSLTEEGQRLYDELSPMVTSIERVVRSVGQTRDEPVGLIRINTSRVAARLLIEPHLEELARRYPGIRLDLVMDDGMANIVADGFDAGIRLGESLSEHMVAIPITPPMRLSVAGTPEYFERHGRPCTPQDLLQHNCLRFRTGGGGIHSWEFTSAEDGHHDFAIVPDGTLTTNDDDAMIRSALQHIGLVQHFEAALRPYFESGQLLRVLEEWSTSFPGFYLYVPSRTRLPLKVRALIDLLVEKHRSHLALASST